MMKLCLLALIVITLVSCSTRSNSSLSKVHLVSLKGTTETITHKERLKKYEQEAALTSQPYKKIIRIFKNKDEFKSVVTTYHPNQQLYQRLECKDGQACGSYQEWHPNGQLKIQSVVIKGVPDVEESGQNSWVFEGKSEAYDESGNLSARFYYSEGKLDGEMAEFYPSGQLKNKALYSNGKLNGDVVGYDAQGHIKQLSHYSEGLLEGTVKKYWDNQRLLSEERYEKGVLKSGIYFDPLGALLSRIEHGTGQKTIFESDGSYQLIDYQQGVELGKVSVYSAQKKLLNSYFQKNGLKTGEEILYDIEHERPKLTLEWSDGKVHGAVKTWYENGQIESQREMSLNKKHGITTAWYKDGSLMLVEEYDQDKLVKGKYFVKGKTIPTTIIESGEGTATLFDENGVFVRKTTYSGGKPIE